MPTRHMFLGLCCMSGSKRRQDMAMEPTKVTFPVILLWYRLKKSTERHHMRRSSCCCPPERKGMPLGPLIAFRLSAVTISSAVALSCICPAERQIAASIPGLDKRHAMKTLKSCITNGHLGTPMLWPSGVTPTFRRLHPLRTGHSLLVQLSRYTGILSLPWGGYKELQAGQHAYMMVFGTPSILWAVLISVGKDWRNCSSLGLGDKLWPIIFTKSSFREWSLELLASWGKWSRLS